MHGGLSAVEKETVISEFQEKQIEVLLVQVKIAEGWNATRCQDVIHWTRDWSPAINSQFEDRAHRMGQKGTVNVQIPIVRKTVEMLIHKRLTMKGADAEQALRTVTIEELMEAL
jgi:SWI/SNF-related matrix-associated actin-dependent regulator 1 of chromatin subfamily A